MPDRPRPSAAQLARYAEEFNVSLPLRYFGVRVTFPSTDRVRVDLDVKPEHLGGLGVAAVNGGVLAAVFDLAIGCTPALIDPTKRTATMNLSMSFMRPVFGARLHAEAWIDSIGKATLFSAGRIYDESGNVCAKCDGMVKLSGLTWETGNSPAVR